MNRLLLSSALIASLGGLLFGFDTAVISGTTRQLQETYDLSAGSLGFTVAIALIGTILGSLLLGRPADRFGRWVCLILIALLYAASAAGSALAWDWISLLFFRFIGGIAVGGSSVVAPTYVAEISTPQLRGRLVALTQLNIVLGILLAYLSNYGIAGLKIGDEEWRWMFGVETAPALAFLVLMFLAPKSPRWLAAQGRTFEARAVLERLRGPGEDIDRELASIERSLAAESRLEHDRLFQRKYFKPIMLAIAIAAFNQLSGINALMYYAPMIFQMAGAGEDSALAQAVIVGGVSLIFTMAAMACIDRLGRRTLMIAGSLGYIVSLSSTAWAFHSLAASPGEGPSRLVLPSLLVFIASHAFGQGAVIWVFLSETFPNRVRARGQALGSFTHWAMAAVISWTFPVVAEISGAYVFGFYAAMMALQLVWVLKVMPETKGVPLEDVQARLTSRDSGITP